MMMMTCHPRDSFPTVRLGCGEEGRGRLNGETGGGGREGNGRPFLGDAAAGSARLEREMLFT